MEVLDVGSSLTSNRLDMAPLCHVDVAGVVPARMTGSDVGIEEPLPPLIYIAAFPFPGLDEGRRFTMTEDERGIIVESSLNSGGHVTSVALRDRNWSRRLTLLGRGIVDRQVKVVCLTHVVGENDFTLQIEDRDTRAIEGNPRFVLPRIKLVKDRRCHMYLKKMLIQLG